MPRNGAAVYQLAENKQTSKMEMIVLRILFDLEEQEILRCKLNKLDNVEPAIQ